MHTFLLIALIVIACLIIVTVLMQEPKSAGLSGAISGGAEQLFGKSKARGVELVLHRVTIVLSVLFFVVAILIAKY